jgi:hypothetical protein
VRKVWKMAGRAVQGGTGRAIASEIDRSARRSRNKNQVGTGRLV